mmetsp:Transcript_95968/g.268626  ORF Transcript_95968/g.268626 Transcript_95968/m.268626 type:complete len:276 (-) Transcript_95968:85-912(-)
MQHQVREGQRPERRVRVRWGGFGVLCRPPSFPRPRHRRAVEHGFRGGCCRGRQRLDRRRKLRTVLRAAVRPRQAPEWQLGRFAPGARGQTNGRPGLQHRSRCHRRSQLRHSDPWRRPGHFQGRLREAVSCACAWRPRRVRLRHALRGMQIERGVRALARGVAGWLRVALRLAPVDGRWRPDQQPVRHVSPREVPVRVVGEEWRRAHGRRQVSRGALHDLMPHDMSCSRSAACTECAGAHQRPLGTQSAACASFCMLGHRLLALARLRRARCGQGA